MVDKSNYDEKQKARQIFNSALLMYHHVPVSVSGEDHEDSKPEVGIAKRLRHVLAVLSNLISR